VGYQLKLYLNPCEIRANTPLSSPLNEVRERGA
jgi:hypothetical protein